MTTPSSTQVAELVKKCYDSAIRFEGSEPSGLLVAAGDNLLKLQSQKDQLEKERDENQKVLSSVMATSVSNLKERYMDLLERCNKEHLPSKYKSWEEVWNRHVALVKERDQLEKMVLTLREDLELNQKAMFKLERSVCLTIEECAILDTATAKALNSTHQPANWVRRETSEQLREALKFLLAVRQDVISTLIAGQISGWQKIDQAFEDAKLLAEQGK